MFLKICLSIAILSGLCSNSNTGNDKKFTVIGVALNSKGGAIVKTKAGIYFVDGLYRWDEKYYGKRVKVTGILIIEHHEKTSTDSLEVQELVGKQAILKKPKWSLAE